MRPIKWGKSGNTSGNLNARAVPILRRYSLNLVHTNQTVIVTTLFRLIWHQTGIRLAPNQSFVSKEIGVESIGEM